MRAWQIYKHGGTEELGLSTTRQLPVITHPQDVLVKVHAASINPIDILIMGELMCKLINLVSLIR